MLSYDNDLSLPVLVPMKTSFPSVKALKLSIGWQFTCFQIKFITNKFFFTGRCHFQLSNIRITKWFWLAGDDDYLRGATSINHQVALRANFKMYSRFAKDGEKGDSNRNPWLAKMTCTMRIKKILILWQHCHLCVLRYDISRFEKLCRACILCMLWYVSTLNKTLFIIYLFYYIITGVSCDPNTIAMLSLTCCNV
jgi:hypothetical protein